MASVVVGVLLSAGCTSSPEPHLSLGRPTVAGVTTGTRGQGEEIDPRACYRAGLLHARCGRHERAVSSFTKAITLDPELAEAYMERGVALLALRSIPAAIEDLSKALELRVRSPGQAHYWRAVALSSQDLRHAAIQDLDSAINLKYALDQSLTLRAMLHFEMGEYNLAIADFTNALANSPSSYEAHLGRGMVWSKLDQDKLALGDFDAAAILRPEAGEPHYHRAVVWFGLQRWPKALEACDMALSAASLNLDVQDATLELRELVLEEQAEDN